MEKKAIAESIAKMAQEASHTVNHLGQEARSVGNAIGGEETGAALNAAGTAAVISLGLVAGGAGIIVRRADTKSKTYYNKLDMYGGLGVPMDEQCKPLTNVGFANWKKADLMTKDGKVLSSSEVIAKHISHNKDKAITRDFANDTSIWNIFLFSKQLVKNRVAFAVRGNYPPRIELSLDEFNIDIFSERNNLTDRDLTKLIDKMRDKGAYLTASGSSLREKGEFNLTGSFSGLEESLKILNSKPYKGVEELNRLRERIQDELGKSTLFGFDVPKLEVSSEALSSLTTEELQNVTDRLKDCKVSVVSNSDGSMTLAGFEEDFRAFLGDIMLGHNSKFDALRNSITEHFKSQPMAEFTRDVLSLKRELKGFEAVIKFKMNKGRCIIQTEHGLEDIVHVLMAANRVPESWDKGIKKQLREWSLTNSVDEKTHASFMYGEHQGSVSVQRTLYSRVMDEELSATSEVAKNELLFIENGKPITPFRDGELERVVAEKTKDFQDAMKQSVGNGVTLSEETIKALAEAMRSAGQQGGVTDEFTEYPFGL